MSQAINLQDTSYTGTSAGYFITRAVVEAETITKGCIYVQETNFRLHIPRVEITNFIQKFASTPTSQGSVTVDGNILEPKRMMLYYEFEPSIFEAHWTSEELSKELLTRELPATAESYILLQTFKRLNEFTENAIWRSRQVFDPANAGYVTPASKGQEAGDSAYLYFDGLMSRLLADSGTIQVPGLTAGSTINTSNFFTVMGNIYNLVPKALIGKYGPKGLKFLMGPRTFQTMEQSYNVPTITAYKEGNPSDVVNKAYLGYDVVKLNGIPDNTIIACIACPDQTSNTWLGVSSTSDDTQVQLAKLQPNSSLYFVKGLFKMDTNFGFSDQVVVWTPLVA